MDESEALRRLQLGPLDSATSRRLYESVSKRRASYTGATPRRAIDRCWSRFGAAASGLVSH